MPTVYLTANPKAKGDGSKLSKPLYAGSGRIDQILGDYWRSGQENLNVRLAPGVYETLGNANYGGGIQEPPEGWQGWRCRSGWTISGSGASTTILRILRVWPHYSNPDRDGCAAIATTYSDVDHVTVEGLTVDCRADEISTGKSNISGVSLLGSHHTIRTVRVINSCGQSLVNQINENFPIHIACHSRNSENNLIELCEVSRFAGGSGGKITMSNNNNNGVEPLTWTSGVVRDCKVVGSQIGFGGWGMAGVLFEDCQAINCDYGYNVDSLSNRCVSIRGCKFLRCKRYGIVLASGECWQIYNNHVVAPETVLLIGDVGWVTLQKNVFTGNPLSWRNPELALGPVVSDTPVSSAVPSSLVISIA